MGAGGALSAACDVAATPPTRAAAETMKSPTRNLLNIPTAPPLIRRPRLSSIRQSIRTISVMLQQHRYSRLERCPGLCGKYRPPAVTVQPAVAKNRPDQGQGEVCSRRSRGWPAFGAVRGTPGTGLAHRRRCGKRDTGYRAAALPGRWWRVPRQSHLWRRACQRERVTARAQPTLGRHAEQAFQQRASATCQQLFKQLFAHLNIHLAHRRCRCLATPGSRATRTPRASETPFQAT